MERATFAAGCFWGVEAAFRQLEGVVEAQVGYTGGTAPEPSYEEVCTGRTGHAEAVEVTFDPERVGYEELLRLFFEVHDPTQMNRQGPDIGTQYRSVIFYHSPEQEAAARGALRRLDESGRLPRPVATHLCPAAPFYRAEEHHQRYAEKHPSRFGCAL